MGDQVLGAASVGPGGEAILLLVDRADLAALTPRTPDGSFALTRAPHPYGATILVTDGSAVLQRTDCELQTAYPGVQPLPGGELLVAGGRCSRFEDGTYERNALILGPGGEPRRDFLLGDGIQSMQTAVDGSIWVSYFDEGVYGNFGWGAGGETPAPVGAAGLVRFDADGTRMWEFATPAGVGPIDDCYALNVAADAAWAYYYSDFPLARVGAGDEVRAWSTPVAGACAVAVGGDHALLLGGYSAAGERCVVCAFDGAQLRPVDEFRLKLPRRSRTIVGRGPLLHVFDDRAWYALDVRDVVGGWDR